MARAKNGHVSEEEQVEDVNQMEEDEEYEIEDILDAKPDMFEGGKIGYLVKWKGYPEDQNSWVSEEDAFNCNDLIDNFWAKNGHKKGKPKTAPRKSETSKASTPSVTATKRRASPEDAASESASAPPKKRGRPPKEKTVSESEADEPKTNKSASAATKKGRKSAVQPARQNKDDDAMDEDPVQEFGDMRKWKDTPSWEHLVDHIDTVEKTEDGKLWVYFQLNKKGKNEMCREETSICRKKMPNLLFDFYEHNLRWRPFDG